MRYLALMLVLCTVAAWGNDGRVVGEGGRVRLLDDERTTVRMVSESVRMTLRPNEYDVTADFLFKNDGPAVTVTMGFPEGGGGDGIGDYVTRSGFLIFRTWVDGKEVTAARKADADAGGYLAFWVKSVAFAPGQTRRVRVMFRSRPGHDISNSRNAFYVFSGGNWAGTVEETTLQVTVETPGTFVINTAPLPNMAAVEHSGWTGDAFEARWKDWQAQGVFPLGYRSTYPDWRTIDGLSELETPGAQAVTVTRPGATPALDWLPPAVVRKGVTFIQLRALCTYLNQQADKAKRQQQAVLTWDAATYTAVLIAGSHRLNFQLKRATLMVNDRPVPLPAAPFLSRPHSSIGAGRLYVPLSASLAALGGTASDNLDTNCVKLTVPQLCEEE